MTGTLIAPFRPLEGAPATGDIPTATRIRREKQAAIVEIRGDVTLYSSPNVRKVILKTLDDHAVQRVIVNFNSVKFLDSSGLASLVECLLYSRKSHQRLSLCGLRDGPRRVLELTRLIDVFEVFDDMETALSALPHGPQPIPYSR